MNPFELFDSEGIYKVAILYFSKSRGLAIIGRSISDDTLEVIQISGEVDPHSGNFTALDYTDSNKLKELPVISKKDFETLVSFIEAKIDSETRMSVIEPEAIKSALSRAVFSDQGQHIH
jgi:hypothetical protein